jgi:hypothetical protein
MGLETDIRVSTPCDLVLKPLYAAILLDFAQDLEDRFAYGPFGIIYGLIVYFLFFILFYFFNFFFSIVSFIEFVVGSCGLI